MTLTIARRPDTLFLNRMNRLFDDAFSPWLAQQSDEGTITSSWVPMCDVFEDSDNLKIIAEIPGVNPEDVKLSLENNTLMIRGEKKQVAEEKTDRVHRYERVYGSFERVFSLPSTVDPERIEAHYHAGLLTVTLPKAERARPREIPVSVR